MLRGHRILVADDDPDLLGSVSQLLEIEGATVKTASNGAELIESLGSDDHYDLVITDVSMPWMTGLQAMHSSRYAGLATPVIVMTALRGEKIPQQVQALGALAALLPKPFDRDQLLDLATSMVSARTRPLAHAPRR